MIRRTIALLLLLALPAHAQTWLTAIDHHPKLIAPHAYHFVLKLHAQPVGNVYFVGAQYDFAGQTPGMAVDYAYDGAGLDFTDSRLCIAIAPTLYTAWVGNINGWAIVDVADGRFEGVVYAEGELARVWFMIWADEFRNGRAR